MADDDSGIDVSVEPYYGTEQPFVPTQGKTVDFVMEEIPSDEYSYAPPTTDTSSQLPNFSVVFSLMPEKSTWTTSEGEQVSEPLKPLVVDIETSGLNPWESRIIVIGVKDVMQQEEPVIQFSDPDEMKMLEDFLNFFNAGGYNQIIGFNVGFDYRFIFSAMMRYRLQCPKLYYAKLFDIANTMKQVKDSYVYNANKQGDLDKWSRYLLNMKKTMTAEEMLTAWDEGRILDILNYNENDVILEYYLWGLIKYTLAEVSAVEVKMPTSAQSASGSTRSGPITVQCPNCLAENIVPAGRQTYTCDICGQTNTV